MKWFNATLIQVRVTILGLAGGLIVLMGFCMFMLHQIKPGGFVAANAPQWGNLLLLTTLFCGLSFLLFLASLGLPRWIVASNLARWAKQAERYPHDVTGLDQSLTDWIEQAPETSLKSLLQIFQTGKIIPAALCEAGGMLCAMAYLLEAHPASIVMVFISICLMLYRFPSQSEMNGWLLQQFEKLQKGYWDTAAE